MSDTQAAATAAPPPVKKQGGGRKRKPRKRRRRNVKTNAAGSSSDSDSSSSSSSESSDEQVATVKSIPVKVPTKKAASSSSSSSSSSSDSSSSSSSDSDSDSEPAVTVRPSTTIAKSSTTARTRRRSLSPLDHSIPSFNPPQATTLSRSRQDKSTRPTFALTAEDLHVPDHDTHELNSTAAADQDVQTTATPMNATTSTTKLSDEEQQARTERQAQFRKCWMSQVVSAFGNDLEHLRKVSVCT